MTFSSKALEIASNSDVQLVAAQRQYLIYTLDDEHDDEMHIVDRYGWIHDYCNGDSDLAYEVIEAVLHDPNRVRVRCLDEALAAMPGQPLQLALF